MNDFQLEKPLAIAEGMEKLLYWGINKREQKNTRLPVHSAKFYKCPSYAPREPEPWWALAQTKRGRQRMPTFGGLLRTGKTKYHLKVWQGGCLACELWQLSPHGWDNCIKNPKMNCDGLSFCSCTCSTVTAWLHCQPRRTQGLLERLHP